MSNKTEVMDTTLQNYAGSFCTERSACKWPRQISKNIRPEMNFHQDSDAATYDSNNKNGPTYLTPLIPEVLMMFTLNNNVVNGPIQTLKSGCQRPW